MKYWVALYGTVITFLIGNSSEFINDEFMTFYETQNINAHTTGAESPWSNGIFEWKNLVLSEMLKMVLAENHCSLDMALTWCLNAKNYLQNVLGFSPFQLAIGQNTSLLNAANDKLSARSSTQTNEIIRQHLKNIHKATEAFIMTQNSEKIKKQLRWNAQTSNNIIIGDSVYYKRACDRWWRGPAKDLGKDGQQVLVKHGGICLMWSMLNGLRTAITSIKKDII